MEQQNANTQRQTFDHPAGPNHDAGWRSLEGGTVVNGLGRYERRWQKGSGSAAMLTVLQVPWPMVDRADEPLRV
jgi:hypothetical protein